MSLHSLKVFAVGVLLALPCDSRGSDSELLAEIGSEFFSYAEALDVKREQVASLTRVEFWRAAGTEFKTVDLIFGRLAIGQEEERLLAFSGLANGSERTRIWEQACANGKQVVLRVGFHNRRDFIMKVAASNAADVEKKRVHADLNPYFLPLAIPSDVYRAKGKLDLNYAEKWFSLNGKLVGAYKDKEGRPVGVWKIGEKGGSIVDVTFAPTSFRPVQTVWRHMKHPDMDWENRDMLPVFSVSRSTWKQFLDNGENVWLPVAVEMNEVSEDAPGRELRAIVDWKLRGLESKFPSNNELELNKQSMQFIDWREGIRELFDEDWSLNFRERVEELGLESD